MRIPFLLALSVLSEHTRAACIPNYTPAINALGPLQVLNYNDLGPEDAKSTVAVLALRKQTHSTAEATCSSIGERLYRIPEKGSNRLEELQYQVNYLLYTGDLTPHGSLWVDGSSSHGCIAYAYSEGKLKTVPCDTELRVLCTSSPAPTTEESFEPEVNSKISMKANDYSLIGYRDARSFRFLGIPFADAPVDKLRLMPPQPYSGPKTLSATSYGKSCMQTVGDDSDVKVSEDCLYINVYTPILPAGEPGVEYRPRPVAVYIYGGAFIGGTSASAMIDGGDFASRNDVVIVTFNYRLGALGFLATDSVLAGSQGIKDQILALEWVKKHIASFGGDPEHVTIFGESAGAQSVVALLSSSAAKGLFGGAIAESSPISLPWFTRDVYSKFIIPQVSSDLGCNDTSSEKELVACLQAAPAGEFLQIDTGAFTVNEGYLHTSALVANIEPYMPVVDDTASGVIDDQFDVLLAQGKLPNHVPSIFTVVKDEAAAWLNIVPSLGSSQAALNSALSIAYPSDLAKKMVNSGVFLVNSSMSDGVRVAIASFLTKSEWICPHSYLLENAVEIGSFPVLYEGLFTRGYMPNSTDVAQLCVPNDDYNATCHGSNVIPAWGTMNLLTSQHYYDSKGLPHSQLMNDVYSAFFRTYNPNPDVDMLKARGPAYGVTYNIFAEQGYHIRQFTSEKEYINKFGFPPSYTEGPLFPKQCGVFEDYGFTFQRSGITE